MGSARSLSECVSTFLLWLGKRSKPGTVNFYRIYLNRFVTAMEDVPIESIRRLAVECWSVERNPLVCVKRFFSWAVDVAELLPSSPLAAVKIPKVGQRTRTLVRLERVLARRYSPRILRQPILTMEQTAARPQEVRVLRWDMIQPKPSPSQIAVNLADGHHWFQLPEWKAKDRMADQTEGRILVITPRVGKLLERMRRNCPEARGEIFLSPSGKPWTPNGFRCAFRRLRQRLTKSGMVNAKGLVPYLYRHTRATQLAKEGANMAVLKRWMGHKKIETTAKYCHIENEDVLALGRRRWK